MEIDGCVPFLFLSVLVCKHNDEITYNKTRDYTLHESGNAILSLSENFTYIFFIKSMITILYSKQL